MGTCYSDSFGTNCYSYGYCCKITTVNTGSSTTNYYLCTGCQSPPLTTTFTKYGTDSQGRRCDCALTGTIPSYLLYTKYISAFTYTVCENSCCASYQTRPQTQPQTQTQDGAPKSDCKIQNCG